MAARVLMLMEAAGVAEEAPAGRVAKLKRM